VFGFGVKLMNETKNVSVVWKESPLLWGGVAMVSLILFFMFYDGLKEMVRLWRVRKNMVMAS